MIIRPEHLEALPDAITHVIDSERPILEAARSPDFDLERLFDAWRLD